MGSAEHAAPHSHDLSHHQSLKANVIMGIIVVILLLTLAFEKGHHFLNHKYDHDKHVKQFVAAFYRVLTVLGLIGLSLFTLIYFGFAKFINDKVFGESEIERVAEHELEEEGESINFAPTQFAEIVEDIQKSIFIAMCLYVLVGLSFTLCLNWQRRKWQKFDKMSFIQIRQNLSTARESSSLLQYWALKMRFLYPQGNLKYSSRYSPSDDDDLELESLSYSRSERNLNETPPLFEPELEKHHRLEPRMIFSRYLTVSYANAVIKIVRLSPSVWLATLATFLLGLPFYHDKRLVTYMVIGFSILIFCVTCLLVQQVNTGVDKITVPLNHTREAILASETQAQAKLAMPQETPLDASDVVVRTDDRLISTFLKLTEGSSIRGSQDNLLFFGKVGKKYMLRLFQVLLFIQVTLIAFSITRLMDPWWKNALASSSDFEELTQGNPMHSKFNSEPGLTALPDLLGATKLRVYLLLAIPGFLCAVNICLLWPSLLNNFMLLTSLEYMVNFEVIDELDTEIATQIQNDRNTLLHTLYAMCLLNQRDESSMTNSGDLATEHLFYELPEHLRNQMVGLHKKIVLSELRRSSGHMTGEPCTGAEAAETLNVPDAFTRVFEDAGSLKERDFINKILAIAYSNGSSDDEQARSNHRREIASQLFDQLDQNNDGFVCSRDMEELVPKLEKSVRLWWSTEVGRIAHYTDRETFTEIFSAALAEVISQGDPSHESHHS